MRLSLILTFVGLVSAIGGGQAIAQSNDVLARVRQAAEVCHASVTAASADRPEVWRRASAAGFVQPAPDQPREWKGDGMTVQLEPLNLACKVTVSGPGLRPTAIISTVGDWARSAGFVAGQHPRFPISMESADHYLDGRAWPDRFAFELGWLD